MGLDVLCAGEAIADFISRTNGDYSMRPGGSSLITATALGRQGRSVGLLTRVGDDVFGEHLVTHAAESNVVWVNEIGPLPTTLAIASLDSAGTAQYGFYVDCSSGGTWSVADIPTELDTKFVSTSGSLSLGLAANENAFALLAERAHEQSIFLFDPNVRPSLMRTTTGRRRIDEWAELAHVIKLSEEDLNWCGGNESMLMHWAQTKPVFVTHGASGATMFRAGERFDVDAPVVEVVDSVGAGDTFTAGIIGGLLDLGVSEPSDLAGVSTDEFRAISQEACALAADTCTRAGGDPPWST